MDRSKQADRYFKWKQYQNTHRDILLEFADKTGIYDKNAPEEFVLAEAYSRALAARAILNNYRNVTIIPQPLYHHFDFLIIDEDGNKRGVEAKFRLNDSDEYPTDDISYTKKDFNATASTEFPIDLYYTFFDGTVRVYDLNGKSNDGTWTHSSTTAAAGRTITDSRLSYNPMDALWTTTVSIPL